LCLDGAPYTEAGGGKLSISNISHNPICRGRAISKESFSENFWEKQKGMLLMVVCRPWRTLAAAIRGIIAACVYNREYVDPGIIKIGRNFVIFEIA